ncbi:MAG: ABC transporter permease [Polyangiaceae bacterium]|nr:ABC transporter permease [Polyangiaceae bacterium]
MGVLAGAIARRIVRLDWDGSELWRNLEKMGVRSLPIVVVTALFTGGIMVIQAAPIVQKYGAQALLGWGAGFSVLREIGPLLTALMLSGRIGANNTAELGTMMVTEQVDGLRALAIDPVSYLVTPRFLGIVVTLFLSTIFSDAVSLIGAAYGGWAILGVEPQVFFNGLTGGLLGLGDVMHGLIKAVVFGVMIGITSCQFGMSTTGGAPGVGRSVNAAVVVSAAGIFVVDYFVSFAIA